MAGERAARYRTLYYDTPDFALYHSHHAGALNRYKVRAREYVDSALSFFEVKHKTNKKRVLFWLEHEWGFHYESAKSIRYERIELIKPEHHPLLLADLCERTGLPIKRFEIGRINFLDDSAEIKIYYDEPKAQRVSGEELLLELDEA